MTSRSRLVNSSQVGCFVFGSPPARYTATPRTQIALAIQDAAQGGEKFGAAVVLRDVGIGAGFECRVNVVVLLVKGQRNQFYVAVTLLDMRNSIDAARSGHAQVHHDDVGLEFSNLAYARLAVGRCTDDFETGFGLDQ